MIDDTLLQEDAACEELNYEYIDAAIEAILFVSGDAVEIKRISEAMELSSEEIVNACKRIAVKLDTEKMGIRLLITDNVAQLCSAPEFSQIIRKTLEKRKPPKLSVSAMEVLSIVAYYQPVTKAYIEQVRGVDSTYTIGILLDRGLIEEAGKLPVPGRPRLFKTTNDFLRTFGITSLEDLPELPESDQILEGDVIPAFEVVEKEI